MLIIAHGGRNDNREFGKVYNSNTSPHRYKATEKVWPNVQQSVASHEYR